ncbi:MAG TPA: ATP-binding cassette domain-containing protein [Gemmataceae bacterium]|nr:ATP-binding cassette domain-containing protein [Gemmataceae bacterium]
MEIVIDIRDLTKHYGGRPAVDRLRLEVPRGAIFALLGDNGAGKTTTIRMLTGLLPPDAGRALVLGHDCWNDAVELRQRVGYMPERPRFYDWMTVAELGWFTAGFHRPGFLPRFLERAAHFELEPKKRLSHLSKGQYAKVGLALALAHNPEVLILDEPTSGLDLLVRREFLANMVGLAAEGRTILISSHQIAEIERVASHVAFLAHGRLLLTGTLDDLRKRLVRLSLQHNGTPPEVKGLGTVLERNGLGQQWQATVLDPNRGAIDALRHTAGVSAFEETALGLEEAYCALLARRERQS